MSKKIIAVFAIVLTLTSCGTAATEEPSAVTTEATTAAPVEESSSEAESIPRDDLTIHDIIFPGEVNPEITYKSSDTYYSVSIDDSWDLSLNMLPQNGDILWSSMQDDAKLYFVVNVSPESDFDKLVNTEVDITEETINGYTIYTFKYNGTTGYTACRSLGDTNYLLSVNDFVFDNPPKEDFNALIEKLKIAP